MAPQITSLTILYSIVYSAVDKKKKHQSSASLAFVRLIRRTNGQQRLNASILWRYHVNSRNLSERITIRGSFHERFFHSIVNQIRGKIGFSVTQLQVATSLPNWLIPSYSSLSLSLSLINSISKPTSDNLLFTPHRFCIPSAILLSGVPDFFDRNKILSGGDLSHYQVPHCIRVFFYFVWFVFIHHNFQFYFELCTYCNMLDIYLS